MAEKADVENKVPSTDTLVFPYLYPFYYTTRVLYMYTLCTFSIQSAVVDVEISYLEPLFKVDHHYNSRCGVR